MPPDLNDFLKTFEGIAQVFGASLAPILFAFWIWTQRPKDKPIDTSPFDKLREEMVNRMDKIEDGVVDIRERVSKIEGGLGL